MSKDNDGSIDLLFIPLKHLSAIVDMNRTPRSSSIDHPIDTRARSASSMMLLPKRGKIRRQTLLKRMVISASIITLGMSAIGCSSMGAARHATQTRQTYQPLPTDRLGISHQVQSTAIPAYYTPSPGVTRMASATGNRAVSDDGMIAAWDVFGDPRLRWLLTTGLRNSPTRSAITQRFVDASLPESQSVPAGHIDAKHFYMITLARQICKVRFHQHRLRSLQQHLDRQGDTFDDARIRMEVGTITRAELLQLVARAQKTEEMIPTEQQELDLLIARIEPLVGQTLTDPLIDSLGDQPALTLPKINDRIPAKKLTNRCDVHSATNHVKQLGQQSGLNESEILPALALQGFIRVEQQSTGPGFDPQELKLGAIDQWSFSTNDNQFNRSLQQGTALQQSMTVYHQTVTNAAGQIKRLLTDYNRLRTKVRRFNDSRQAAFDELQRTTELLSVDRAGAGDLVNAQTRLMELDMDIHETEYELSLAAIDLFISLGGPCHANQITTANYYE